MRHNGNDGSPGGATARDADDRGENTHETRAEQRPTGCSEHSDDGEAEHADDAQERGCHTRIVRRIEGRERAACEERSRDGERDEPDGQSAVLSGGIVDVFGALWSNPAAIGNGSVVR